MGIIKTKAAKTADRRQPMSEENTLEPEFGSEILTIMDEEGAEHEFELLDTEEIDGVRYVALAPVFDEAEDLLEDSGELVVLRATTEDGEDYLDAIEDEEEFDRISEFFMERLQDRFEFED
jgi:uncharacterized protein YrzB (UPF0473 family)